MAFGSIELTTISRAQDYSTIKQNEDNKAFVDQTNSQFQVQKNERQKNREVHSSDDVQWHESKPDAREKGKSEYYGDGGKHRKEQEKEQAKERVLIKGQGGFDIKV